MVVLPLYAGSSLECDGFDVSVGGALAVPASFSNLAYEVWRHLAIGPDEQTGGGPLPAGTILDPPEADGVNLRFEVPGSSLVISGLYEIKLIFTLAGSGLDASDIWEARIVHAPP